MKVQHSWQVNVATTAANLPMMGIALQTVPQRVLDRLSAGRPIWVAGELRLIDRRAHFYATESRNAVGSGTVRFRVDIWGNPMGQVFPGTRGWTYQNVSLWQRGTEIAVRMSKGDARAFLAAAAAAERSGAVPDQPTPRR